MSTYNHHHAEKHCVKDCSTSSTSSASDLLERRCDIVKMKRGPRGVVKAPMGKQVRPVQSALREI